MEAILNENLFLLEFLIDQINLHPGAIPTELEYVVGETCVSIQFLDNDPLDIDEADFNSNKEANYNTEACMKNGKSCLFAISPEQADSAMHSFDINVTICKKLTYGVLPDKVKIGTAKIQLETLFNEILGVLKENSDAGTVSKTLKDIYPIIPIQKSEKCCIGDITVFVRMSCFGKLIVTQFQMNLQEKSVFFKDKDGRSIYKYRKACQREGQGEECMEYCPGPDDCMNQSSCYPTSCLSSPCYQVPCGTPSSNIFCPSPCSPPTGSPPPCNSLPCLLPQYTPRPCFLQPCKPPPCNPPPCNPPPCNPPPCNPLPCNPPPCNPPPCNPQPCYPPPCNPQPCSFTPPCNPQPCSFPPSCNAHPCSFPPSCNMQPCSFPPPCNFLPPCNFPPPCSFPPCSTCGPSINGEGIGVTGIPDSDASRNECTDLVPCSPSLPPSRPPPDNSCYQEIGAEMNGNALTIRVHKNKGFSVKRIDEQGKEIALITDCSCDKSKASGCGCSAGQTAQPPSNACACLMPSKPSPCINQALSMKQADDPGNPFTFKVSGCGTQANRNVTIVPPSSTKSGDAPGKITDFNKDVFVLRIGKKSEGTEKKANLELELITPKGRDKKPIARKETRETQVHESDLGRLMPKDEKGSKKKGGKPSKKGKIDKSDKFDECVDRFMKEKDIKDKEVKDKNAKDKDVKEKDVKDKDVKDKDVNDKDVKGKDMKDMDVKDKGRENKDCDGGAAIRGPKGKILRVIGANGTVRNADGKIIIKKPKPPLSRASMIVPDHSLSVCVSRSPCGRSRSRGNSCCRSYTQGRCPMWRTRNC